MNARQHDQPDNQRIKSVFHDSFGRGFIGLMPPSSGLEAHDRPANQKKVTTASG
jgi:hypothetical protein